MSLERADMKYKFLLLLLMFCHVKGANYNYFSQFEQDKYIHEKFFLNKLNGTFVDIGAFDGVTISNTFFFEKHLNWTGICVEPNPKIFKKLKKNRSCICIEGGIAESTGKQNFRLAGVLSGLVDYYDERHMQRYNLYAKPVIEVQCYTLESILKKHGIFDIDFLSIDTEGNELSILKTIDFNKISIDVITVENNYGNKEIRVFLEEKGYKLVKRLGVDEIYKKA